MKSSSSEHFRVAPAIPDHEMLRLIGQGSYGQVWLARSVTGALRAVKVVQRSDFQYERTFEREFEGIRKFEPISRSHPGLVDVLHVGRNLDDGFYYYVMELGDDRVRGAEIIPELYIARTLASDLEERGRLSVDECIDAGANLGDGLHYLHQRGLTHRDVKPSNVIFVEGVAKLADIGLVAASGQRTFVGTEGFVPPEGPGAPEADIYSLGMVLYEISTGNDRLEFPALPAKLPPEEDRPKWRALNGVVCTACAQEPKNRHSNAGEFAVALRRIKSGKVRRKTLRGRLCRTVMFAGLLATLIMLVRHGDFLRAAGESRTVMANDAGGRADPQPVVPEPPSGGGGATGEQNPPPSIPAIPVEEPAEKFGWVRIFSQPGVEVRSLDGQLLGVIGSSGQFVDEDVPVGPVRYLLTREGFANRSITGNVLAGLPEGLDGELAVFSPPVDEQAWANSFGMEFVWVDRHVSRLPVPAAVFTRFLDASGAEIAHYGVRVTFPDPNLPGDYPAYSVTREGGQEFCDWMTRESRAAGYLTQQHSYVLNEDVAYDYQEFPVVPEGVDVDLVLLMVAVELSEFAEVELETTPSGVEVFDGERLVGTSPGPLRLDPGPVTLTLKMPGYKSVDVELDLEPGERAERSLVMEETSFAVFGQTWRNSLGMEFVPLEDELLLFGAHEVSVGNFRRFCEATGRPWIHDAGFEQGDDHPVVKIVTEDARAFCLWLTDRERELGQLAEDCEYRLPRDLEWSRAAGIPGEIGDSPAARDSVIRSYPWGTEWPPPDRVANLADKKIRGFEDGFEFTAPVGSFLPNQFGIYDLAGNVWEWIDEEYGGVSSRKNYAVVRGGCFSNSKSVELYASGRNPISPFRESLYGFRVVIAKRAGAGGEG